ncbi:ABC transporter substrate-binding protein [Microbacterium aurantiacum]|uniref:ABC transporter substrate-binding protein n=1 Tax=Microbacterium aurantiacum TaxID=162393 RepID=UPI0034367B48
MRPLRVWLKAGHTVEIIRRMLPRFEDETGIAVDIAVVPESEAHDALAAGAARPDVVTAPFWYLEELCEAGIVAPMALGDLGMNDASFVPLALAALSRRNELYAVPHTLTGGVLSYRADLFAGLGLDAPRTLSDVATAHFVLTDSDLPGLVARCDRQFSSLETYAGWAAARGRTVLPDAGEADADEVAAGIGDLVTMLAARGAALTTLDYAAVGELVVSERASMIFDTSAWVFRFEDDASPVRGRMGYAVIGDDHPAQFLYAEGLALTSWCTQPEAARRFLRWRHSDDVVRAEVEQIGRIDVPRRDLRSREWFDEHVRRRSLGDCLAAIDRSWESGDLRHVARRADFVSRAREVMAAISGVIRGDHPSFADAYGVSPAPTRPPA